MIIIVYACSLTNDDKQNISRLKVNVIQFCSINVNEAIEDEC